MQAFDSFVVFAEMRTGSNFLEANLNALDGVTCHGEAFNPHFIGYPKIDRLLGMDARTRDADPKALLARMRAAPGINGFRYFKDHDPRVFDLVVPDRRCAKIVLTRNPLESYVSWKIAKATGQWKMTNMAHQKVSRPRFDAVEFERHVSAAQAVQRKLMQALQHSGQTAFYVDYEDLQDVEVMNGLAAWLGVEARLDGLDTKLKKQNPSSIRDKVSNPQEMEAALARPDRFNLHRTPNFEPRRGPGVPGWVAAAKAPLLYMPIRSGPGEVIEAWLAGIDGVGVDGLRRSFNQNTLRQWLRGHTPHRAFTVLRHPVARAHVAFCDRILYTGKGSYPKLRHTLRNRYSLPIPEGDTGPDYDDAAHRTAFLAFVHFLKGNLSGQSAIRVDGAWTSQTVALQSMSDFAIPDLILREDQLLEDLAVLAAQVGLEQMPSLPEVTDGHAARLGVIYDAEIEAAVRDTYSRDYEAFGFADWR